VERTQLLISQAVGGNEDAVRRLLILYHPRLRARLVRQMDATLRTRLDPEDILQQVYMEAFRAIDTFEYRGADSFLRWLFTILDRKLIDEHRALHAECRDARREMHAPPVSSNKTTYVDLWNRLSAGDGTASEMVRKNEALGVLAACMATLPDHYRQVVQMRFLQGRPVAEVAAKLNRTVGSIHMICHRALLQLREQVQAFGITSEITTDS